MDIDEGSDDFADDRHVPLHDGFSDDDAMEEEDDEGVSSRKKARSAPTTSSSRRKEIEEEVLDAKGEIRKRQPLIEKYRPTSLEEVVAQDDIVQTITRLMQKNALPHLLLYGPPGTGKTSTILAMARNMYGKEQMNSMVLELNASDTRGIDDIRDQVVTFASTRNLFSKSMKLVILDEADNMTRDAQFALRRVIEKYTTNTRFCLICNYVSKIIPALQSRCTRFRFSPLAPEQVRGRVEQICRAEEIDCTDDGMTALLRLSRGDMRKVLNLLEASAMQRSELDENGLRKKPRVDANLVYQVAGKPTPAEVTTIWTSLWNQPLQQCFDIIGSMQIEKGLALTDVVTELHDQACEMEAPPAVMKFLLKELAECEARLATAVDDKIQLLGLISIFIQSRRLIAEGMS